jgi:predicted AlkP superfamily pyrophosphatase or phosphodiesterase
MQRFGPDEDHPAVARSLREVDGVVGDLAAEADRLGYQIIVLSEYGIVPVDQPVHLNRALRQAGLLAIREEEGRELLDPTASTAFAVADHQIAHVYVSQPGALDATRRILENLPGVAEVLDESGKRKHGLDHPRSGELVALSEPRSWFTYYYWEDDARAPDFARTVEIHRKPGYDPVELFVDPALRNPKLAVGLRLAKRRLGFRTLLDVIPLDAGLVKGSHGLPTAPEDGPLVIASEAGLLPEGEPHATEIKDLVLRAVFGASEDVYTGRAEGLPY